MSSTTSGTAGIRPSRPLPTSPTSPSTRCSIVGIALLLRRRVSRFGASLWLDGLLAGHGRSALGFSVLVEVVVNSTHGSPLVVLTNIAYPIGDVVLLALVVFVFAVTRWQPGRAWGLIAAGLLLNTFGDAVYLYQTAVGSYVEGTYLDFVWPVSLVLVAFAAWQRAGSGARGGAEGSRRCSARRSSAA